MSRFTNTLARVRVAAPCEADWDEMRGDERVRFCQHCSLNVYNLSAMTRREAEWLVTRTEGARLCVRYYRRKDGTMLTRPCPVGLRALKRRVSRISSALFAGLMSFAAGVGLTPSRRQSAPVSPSVVQPVAADESDVVQPVAADEAEQYTAIAGGMGYEPGPEDFVVPAGLLAGISLLFGYPLLKLRAWRDTRREEELRIWRRE